VLNTEKTVTSNLFDLDKILKPEKRKKSTILLTEFNKNDTEKSNKKLISPNKNQCDDKEKMIKKALKESNVNQKEFYQLYTDELEKNFESLLTRNRNLKQELRQYEKLEEENWNLKIDMFKYSELKQISEKFKIKNIYTDKEEIRKCKNKKCCEDLQLYKNMLKAYNKLLIENIGLRRDNVSLIKLTKTSKNEHYRTNSTNIINNNMLTDLTNI